MGTDSTTVGSVHDDDYDGDLVDDHVEDHVDNLGGDHGGDLGGHGRVSNGDTRQEKTRHAIGVDIFLLFLYKKSQSCQINRLLLSQRMALQYGLSCA